MLYLIRLTEHGHSIVPSYDVYTGWLVRAESPQAVRELVAQRAADEGQAVWRDPAYSEIIELSHSGQTPEILLSSFQAG